MRRLSLTLLAAKPARVVAQRTGRLLMGDIHPASWFTAQKDFYFCATLRARGRPSACLRASSRPSGTDKNSHKILPVIRLAPYQPAHLAALSNLQLPPQQEGFTAYPADLIPATEADPDSLGVSILDGEEVVGYFVLSRGAQSDKYLPAPDPAGVAWARRRWRRPPILPVGTSRRRNMCFWWSTSATPTPGACTRRRASPTGSCATGANTARSG